MVKEYFGVPVIWQLVLAFPQPLRTHYCSLTIPGPVQVGTEFITRVQMTVSPNRGKGLLFWPNTRSLDKARPNTFRFPLSPQSKVRQIFKF